MMTFRSLLATGFVLVAVAACHSTVAEGADAGTKRAVEKATTPQALTPDQSLETFVGFSPDEKQFAYTLYSEGAGSHLLKIFKVEQNELVQNLPLGEVGELQQGHRLLAEGKFKALPKAPSEWTARWKEKAGVEVSRGGAVQGVAKPLGNPPAEGQTAQAQVWAVSPSGKYVVVEVIVDAGGEFGKARTFALFPVKGK